MMRSLKDKRSVYLQVFGSEAAREVLSDLRATCFATKTTFVKGDPDQTLINEGRRQVFMDIMTMMKVDFEDYYEYDDYE